MIDPICILQIELKYSSFSIKTGIKILDEQFCYINIITDLAIIRNFTWNERSCKTSTPALRRVNWKTSSRGRAGTSAKGTPIQLTSRWELEHVHKGLKRQGSEWALTGPTVMAISVMAMATATADR